MPGGNPFPQKIRHIVNRTAPCAPGDGVVFSVRTGKKPGKLSVLLSVLFWLAVWELTARALDSALLLVSPVTVLLRLAELIRTGEFWSNVFTSLWRIGAGYLLGAGCGILCGVLCAFFPAAAALFSPLLSVIKATPVTSLVILALVWIKSYNLSIFICFLMVFPILTEAVKEGILSADRELLELALVFRFPAWKKAKLVYLPAVRPQIVTALSTSIGFAWKAGIAGEVFARPTLGVGSRLYDAKVYLETPDLFCWTLLIILLSMAIEKLVLLLLRRGSRETAPEASGKEDA